MKKIITLFTLLSASCVLSVSAFQIVAFHSGSKNRQQNLQVAEHPLISTQLMLNDPSRQILKTKGQFLNQTQIQTLMQQALIRANKRYCDINWLKSIHFNVSQHDLNKINAGNTISVEATGLNHFQQNLTFYLNRTNIPIAHFCVIGDSLSDIGSFASILKNHFHGLGLSGKFYKGRSFCDGPVSVEDINDMLDLPKLDAWRVNQTDNLENYNLDYATASATLLPYTKSLPVGWIVKDQGASKQVQAFMEHHPDKTENQKTLMGYFIGANDFILDLAVFDQYFKFFKWWQVLAEQRLNEMIQVVHDNIVDLLQTAGVGKVLLSNMPSLEQTPSMEAKSSKKVIADLTKWRKEYNAKLNLLVGQLQDTFRHQIKLLDLNKLTDLAKQEFPFHGHDNLNQGLVKVIFNPVTFSMYAFYNKNVIYPHQFFYFDGLHPSGIYADEIANFAYNLIEQPW